jgi:hypothetical protein
MIWASPASAFQPVAPTTAAIAPNAPMGATHMIMARIRNTSRCRCAMPRRIGSTVRPIACNAKPANSATNSVCSTLPLVSAEKTVVGMIPSRNAAVPSSSPFGGSAPLCRSRPLPGCRMLPTSRPMINATVDIARK